MTTVSGEAVKFGCTGNHSECIAVGRHFDEMAVEVSAVLATFSRRLECLDNARGFQALLVRWRECGIYGRAMLRCDQ